MKDFDRLCKTAEELDPVEYGAIIIEKTAKIIPALNAITQDPLHTQAMLASFMIASVYADGKLDEAEYQMMLPMLRLFFGNDFDFKDARAIVKAFRPEGKELKEVVDFVVDLIGEADEELKDDIIIVCLLICAVDGKISRKEKNYIKQLIR